MGTGAYNDFVIRHNATLTNSYERMARHFARLSGGDGQAERDAFVTELANAQSIAGQHDPSYCQNLQSLVTDIPAAETANDMAHLVADHGLVTSMPLTECSELSGRETSNSQTAISNSFK